MLEALEKARECHKKLLSDLDRVVDMGLTLGERMVALLLRVHAMGADAVDPGSGHQQVPAACPRGDHDL